MIARGGQPLRISAGPFHERLHLRGRPEPLGGERSVDPRGNGRSGRLGRLGVAERAEPPAEPHRVPHPNAHGDPPDGLPAHLQVPGEALLVRRVEHEVDLSLERLERRGGEATEHAEPLVVGVGRRVDRTDRLEGAPGGSEPPAHEGPQADDPVVALRHEHEGGPEGVLHMLPTEELGRSLAERPAAEGPSQQLQHPRLVLLRVGPDLVSLESRRPAHPVSSP